jgi:hypothetical protein
MLVRTQFFTRASLQQLAEGLRLWTDVEMKHWSMDWPVFDSQSFLLEVGVDSPPHENFPCFHCDALRRVLVEHCLKPEDKEQVRNMSSVDQVWKYLNWAYLQQDTFPYQLIKLVHAARDISKKNYRDLEEFFWGFADPDF